MEQKIELKPCPFCGRKVAKMAKGGESNERLSIQITAKARIIKPNIGKHLEQKIRKVNLSVEKRRES